VLLELISLNMERLLLLTVYLHQLDSTQLLTPHTNSISINALLLSSVLKELLIMLLLLEFHAPLLNSVLSFKEWTQIVVVTAHLDSTALKALLNL